MLDALPLLPGALALGAALWCHRRARRAEARAAAAEARAAGHARSLGLLAAELQPHGLALLGLAERAGAPGPVIGCEARRLLRLADEVRDMLAAQAGPRSLSEERVDLAALLAEVRAEIAAQLGPARRQWRLAPDFAGISLRADRRALRGALAQVMARAARLTRDADWIDLRPVLTADSLAIVVEDEGAGLGAPDLAAEAEAAEEARTRGLGFGLAVARSLLEAHGGELRLEAQPGVGARAWLILPRARLLAG
jgi:signal transduction histidine kinase